MGYTHYFKNKKRISKIEWKKFCRDVESIIAEDSKTISLESNSDSGLMVNEKDGYISLNGVGDDSYETLYIDKSEKKFNFCKTNRNPYDFTVMRCLLLLNHHWPDYEISSDGNFLNWKNAALKNLEQFNYAFIIPSTIDDSIETKEFNEKYENLIKFNNNLNKILPEKEKSSKYKL